tara:strand:- start:129 stop:719 length:591 start_codon:yes stop_codon:yes gene_type:complete
MKKYIIILFAFIGSFANAQEYDFQEMCLACAESQGYYCGDDPANWTQYAPLGCVQTAWLNDGWEDCVDAGDENGAVPTSPADCAPPPQECDTVYVDVPVVEYIYETDTIVEYETIVEFDTIVEYETIVEYDTVIEIQYEEILEYIDCDSGLPCSSGMQEIVDKSLQNSVIYNIKGQAVLTREGLYIENGKIYYKTK